MLLLGKRLAPLRQTVRQVELQDRLQHLEVS